MAFSNLEKNLININDKNKKLPFSNSEKKLEKKCYLIQLNKNAKKKQWPLPVQKKISSLPTL